jgi:hypothetical protein
MGAIFDRAIISAVQTNASDDIEGNFDINARKGGLENVEKVFGKGSLPSSKLADLKIGIGGESPDSMIRKTLNTSIFRNLLDSEYKQRKIKEKNQISKFEKNKNGKAAGFIPNFNSVNKGVPVSQIRAHFDQSGNPIAVTNTRDEPNGLKDAIGREKEGVGMAAKGFIPNYAATTIMPAGMSTTGLTLPPLPNIAPKVQQLAQTIDTGTKAFGKFGAASLAGSFALSLVSQLIPEIKETDSGFASTAKSLSQSAIQFASIGFTFGPVGAAIGGAFGLLLSGISSLTDWYMKIEKQAEAEYNDNTKRKTSFREFTDTKEARKNYAGVKGNTKKERDDSYKEYLNKLKERGISLDELNSAEMEVKNVYDQFPTDYKKQAEATGAYEAALRDASDALEKSTIKLDIAQTFATSMANFAKKLDSVSTKLSQQKFAEGLAGNVKISSSNPYSESVKSSIEISQSRTTALDSQNDFMKNFKSEDFTKILTDKSKEKLTAMGGDKAISSISGEVFAAYMKNGAEGVTEKLSQYADMQSEDAQKFRDTIISSAETFKNNVAEAMQKAVNRQTELEDKIKETITKISEVNTKLIANLPDTLKKINEGPRVDVGGIYSGYQKAGELIKTGKSGDMEKAQQIIMGLSEQVNKFKELFGEEAFAQLSGKAGVGTKEQEKLQQSAIYGQVDFSGIEEGLRRNFTVIPESIEKALKAAKLDSSKIPALQNAVDAKFEGIDGPRSQKTRRDIQNQLEALKKPQTGKQETDELAKQKTAAAKELEAVTIKIKLLKEEFKPTGIPDAIIALTKSVNDAATNINTFTDFTKTLSSLSENVNQRLLNLEATLNLVKL